MVKNIRSNSAFTLIEMLIVVAIIGIVVGIGVPALKDAKQRAVVAKQNAATANVATAKTRYILDHSKSTYDGLADEAARFAALAPYLLVNGVAPGAPEDLLKSAEGGPVIIGDSDTAPTPTGADDEA